MAPKIPPSLKWLIDKRARIAAEIKKSKASIKVAQGLLEDLSDLEESLAAVDKTLELHEIRVDVSLIEPIRSQYVRIKLPHGELTRTVLLCLRLHSSERPVGLHEITSFVEARYADLGAKPEKRTKLARSVHKCMDRLFRQGIVQRHHPLMTNEEGFWSLASSDDWTGSAHILNP